MLLQGSGPDSQASIEIFPDACLMISILQQWLIRYLCKRMMQILTPEGMAVHYRKIPRSYREVYFKQQEHFSLKNLAVDALKRLTCARYSGTTLLKILSLL